MKFIYFHAFGVTILFRQNSWLELENSFVVNSKWIQNQENMDAQDTQ